MSWFHLMEHFDERDKYNRSEKKWSRNNRRLYLEEEK